MAESEKEFLSESSERASARLYYDKGFVLKIPSGIRPLEYVIGKAEH